MNTRWPCIALWALLLLGCASTPPTAPPPPTPNIPSRLSLEQANDVTLYAISLVGTPYRFGGNTPASGFDCSGLIGHVYQSRAGLGMPRTVAKMQDVGQLVPREQLRTGDLVVFSPRGAATHAGIYVGENRFVHAPSTGGTVRLESLAAKHWAAQTTVFRRP